MWSSDSSKEARSMYTTGSPSLLYLYTSKLTLVSTVPHIRSEDICLPTSQGVIKNVTVGKALGSETTRPLIKSQEHGGLCGSQEEEGWVPLLSEKQQLC